MRWQCRTAAAICLMTMPAASPAKLIPDPRTYRPFDMFDNGYKDKVQPDGTWRIVAGARPIDGPGFANDMALYRAAELTAASGHAYFQILDATGTVMLLYGHPGRETMKLIVRASDRPDPPSDCRSKRADVCTTLDAARILARIGPTLRR